MAKYARNDTIFGEEAMAAERACILFVLSGEVRIQKKSDDRHDDLLEEGDTYGEKALLLGENVTSYLLAFLCLLLLFRGFRALC